LARLAVKRLRAIVSPVIRQSEFSLLRGHRAQGSRSRRPAAIQLSDRQLSKS
jgi:hypothetical protein